MSVSPAVPGALEVSVFIHPSAGRIVGVTDYEGRAGSRLASAAHWSTVPLAKNTSAAGLVGRRRGADRRRLDKREIELAQNGVDGVVDRQLGRVKPQADPRRRFA